MPASVQIAPGVHRIPTAPMDLINSYAFVDDDGQVTLVDAGMPGASGRILAGLRHIGLDPRDVTRILLTHSHADHVGGLTPLREETGGEVAAHVDDARDIRTGRATGGRPPGLLGRLLTLLPGPTPCRVDVELADGQLLPYAGGIEVVHTPGHTPGHVSLLHRPSGTLVTGDAIWNMNSRRTWPTLAFCTDPVLTQQTAHRLGELDYTTAAFTHGPEIRGRGRDAVRDFLARPRRFRMLL
jgi:glyoxylase-like metal-dependent hydrolase (beta-lactamase superfamily II)